MYGFQGSIKEIRRLRPFIMPIFGSFNCNTGFDLAIKLVLIKATCQGASGKDVVRIRFLPPSQGHEPYQSSFRPWALPSKPNLQNAESYVQESDPQTETVVHRCPSIQTLPAKYIPELFPTAKSSRRARCASQSIPRPQIKVSGSFPSSRFIPTPTLVWRLSQPQGFLPSP